MPEVVRMGQGEPERARIAVVGCGGAGCNVLQQVPADLVTRVALNDGPHRSMIGIPARLFLARETLLGLASMDEAAVKELASPEERAVSGAILHHDLVVAVAGLGGLTGGPAAALVGRVSRILGIPSMALATFPFSAEGQHRRAAAEEALGLLSRKVDGVVTFTNDELLTLAPHLPLMQAFQVLGAIMVRPLVDLARALTRTDVAVLKDVLHGPHRWRYGAGEGREKHRAFEAVEDAFKSPWLPTNADLVDRVVAVASSVDFGETDAEEVLHEIHLAAPRASILLGGYADPALGDRLRLSVLAGWW